MAQLINLVSTDFSFGRVVKIDMANNLILAQDHHHQKEAEAEEEGKHHHHQKEAEAKEEGKHHHHQKEAEAKEEGEEEKEGEEVAQFVPTTDFVAENIIYFGSALLSIAILAVILIWIRGISSSGE